MRHCSRLTQSNTVFGMAESAYDGASDRLSAAQRLYVYHRTAGGETQNALQERRRFLQRTVTDRIVIDRIVQRESG